MKKNTAKKTLGFIVGFALSTSGFMLGGFGFMEEALALPDCPGTAPDNFWGFTCVGGNCVTTCDMPAYSTCADVGSSCLAGYACRPICPG